MRTLELNPLKFDITFSADIDQDPDVGVWANVNAKLDGDDPASPTTAGAVDANQALKISKWFADLNKELLKREKSLKA